MSKVEQAAIRAQKYIARTRLVATLRLQLRLARMERARQLELKRSRELRLRFLRASRRHLANY